ncbi:MAG: hypothetical protein Kow0077_24890 [Anaerolineae bacterium]
MWSRVNAFRRRHPDLTLILVLLALLALVQLVLGTRATPIDSVEALNARLTDGRPAVLEFYSNL